MNTSMNNEQTNTPLPEPCYIIGVLDSGIHGLNEHTASLIQSADVVIGASRTLDLFQPYLQELAQTIEITGKLKLIPSQIKEAQNHNLRVVVLATGDPLCHGIATYLQSQLCIESCCVIPTTSTLQLACARIGLSWQDLKVVSVHSKDAGDWTDNAHSEHGLYPIISALINHDKLGIFTSPDNSPSRIAKLLIHLGLSDQYLMAVAANIESPAERIVTDCSAVDMQHLTFDGPNIVLIWRCQAAMRPRLFGLNDHDYIQRKPEKGLITKQEVRAVSLAKMALKLNSQVWDIGAGSGSVGLEAARLCSAGFVHAIEKNIDDYNNAKANQKALGVLNYNVSHAKAPDLLEQWPAPDAVFIGGSGGGLKQIISLAIKRLRVNGCLVINVVTLENLNSAIEQLHTLNAAWDLCQLQASRSSPILDMNRLAAQNPVWIITVVKGADV